MLRSSVGRDSRLEAHYRQVFLWGAVLGAMSSAAVLSIVSGLVSLWSEQIRIALLLVVAVVATYGASDVSRWRMPQRNYLVPQTALLRSRSGAAFRFGFELGLGFRTLIPDHGIYVLAWAVVLLGPEPLIALCMGAAFGLVRGMVPTLQDGIGAIRRSASTALRALNPLQLCSPLAILLLVLGASGTI